MWSRLIALFCPKPQVIGLGRWRLKNPEDALKYSNPDPGYPKYDY